MSVAAPLDGVSAPPGFAEIVGATPERLADVERFRAMLVEANGAFNLVGASTLPEFWTRHFLDSAQLLWFEREARTWADLGAGAGFPGLVLAILLKGQHGGHVHLVESMAKRCRFLDQVVSALDLPAEVHNARAETLDISVDIVTARACAPMGRLLGFSRPFFARGARGLFLKGSDVAAEIAEAKKLWRFDANILTSLSDPRGQVVAIRQLAAQRRH